MGDLCPCKSTVRREKAIKAICERLQELIAQDETLIKQVILEAQQLDARGDHQLEADIEASQRKLASFERKLTDDLDLAGQGSDEDREEMKARIRSVQIERNAARVELNRLQQALSHATSVISKDEIRDSLTHLSTLLREGADGTLGEDALYEAVEAFRLLVGGWIDVHVEQRVGRKQTNFRATFTPRLLDLVSNRSFTVSEHDHARCEVSVWLRKPPPVDLLAERVHELIDIEGLSHRDTAKRLRDEGHNVNSGNVWYSYHRWYEMQGQEPSKLPYNNGHKRDSA